MQSSGRTLISVSLNWLLHHRVSDAAILGASNMGQINESLAAGEDGPSECYEDLRLGLAGPVRSAARVQPMITGSIFGMLKF